MSSALSPPAQGRSWWLRSKPSKESTSLKANKSLTSLTYDEKSSVAGPNKQKDSSSGSKFNTFASAIGLKSKKLPPLDIQDPPAVLTVVHPPAAQGRVDNRRNEPAPTASPVLYNRPSANSIATMRSVDYDGDAASDPHTISEPRTPSDHARDRLSYQTSILSWSDPDPFAAGGVIVQPLVQDPNRLSVYSDSSMLDPHNTKMDFAPRNRVSYGSSLSSSSQGHSSERHAVGVIPTLQGGRTRTNSGLSTEPSMPERTRRDSARRGETLPGERGVPSSRHTTVSGSSSSCSTVTPGGRFNDLPVPPGVPSAANKRARGMTVAVTSAKPVRQLKTSASTLGLSIPYSAPATSLQRKLSESSTSSPVPSPSPVTFARPRSGSTATGSESPVSPYPTAAVRKGSLSRVKLPPLNSAPPAADLPDVPLLPPKSPFTSSPVDSVEDLSTMALFPEPPSSSSSSLSFAAGVDPETGFSDLFGSMVKAGRRIPHAAAKVAKKAQSRDRSKSVRNDPGSPSATVRNFEIDIGPSASSSKLYTSTTSPELGRYAYPTSPKALKKASSQQSLGSKRLSAASQSSVTSGHDEIAAAYSPSPTKPRKQRSFHHSRLPIPPLPALRHTNSYNHSLPPDLQPPSPSSPLVDQRRGSATSQAPSGRKRLFSASSIRKSTSSHAPNSPALSAEDDLRSIVSFDIDSRTQSRPTSSSGEQKITMSFGSFGSPLSLLTKNSCVAPSSFWDDRAIGGKDPLSPGASRRMSQIEYVPQQIMSPADMLKLEEQLTKEAAAAELERERERDREREYERKPKLDLSPGDFGYSFVRPRSGSRDTRPRTNSTFSRTSASTTNTSAFGHSSEEQFGEQDDVRSVNEVLPSVVSRQSSIATLHAKAGNVPLRSSSMQSKSFSKSPTVTSRPSTAQPGLSPPSSPSFSSFTPSPDRPPISLPPPPRARRATELRPVTQPEPTNHRASVVPVFPLSPPPTHGKARRPTTSPLDAREFGQPAPPPSAFAENMLKRRSVMKKPSFLDIDDDEGEMTEEGVSEGEMEPSSPTPMESSFLDLGRGSFDTVRSFDSDM